MHITGPGLDDPLNFETGFLPDEHVLDLKSLRWTYKKQREVARRTEVFRGELASVHPPFPKRPKATCIDIDGPMADVQDIEYSAEGDAIADRIGANINNTALVVGEKVADIFIRELGLGKE
ncbi:hypothetical protein DL767_003474 [Monosporascus sp. MG133]|nr:hypothetical protein DL767_003474 [Monosporascus sp. MG133]